MSDDRPSGDEPAVPGTGRRFPTAEANVATSISQDFIAHVQVLFDLALWNMAEQQPLGDYGINPPSNHALPAFICAAASVESFTNEYFISEMARDAMPDSALFEIPSEWLEKLDLWSKLLLVANLGFKQNLKSGVDPWNRLKILLKIRNDLLHYKMNTKAPSYMQDFVQKKIALHAPGDHLLGWPYQLGTMEAIRWAHNVACDAVAGLAKLDPVRADLFQILASNNFRPITEEDARRRLAALKVNLPKGK